VKTTVRLGQSVKDFIATLAPEPRRTLRRALKDLEKGRGDVRQLEGCLAPHWRLRVKRLRVVYAEKAQGGERVVLCFYANHRPVVYELVEQLLASSLIEELRDF
jgi:mRNA-degrading endonuclease RelE of RelBE toxin-antitoxin system